MYTRIGYIECIVYIVLYCVKWCSNYVMDVFTVLLIRDELAGKVLIRVSFSFFGVFP